MIAALGGILGAILSAVSVQAGAWRQLEELLVVAFVTSVVLVHRGPIATFQLQGINQTLLFTGGLQELAPLALTAPPIPSHPQNALLVIGAV